MHQPQLTDIEEAFCVNYVRTFNAQSAARNAGIKPGLCLNEGSRLMQQTHIIKRIRQLKKHQYSHMLVEGRDIVQKYMNIAFADLFDFVKLGFASVSSEGTDTGGTSIFLHNTDEVSLHLQDVIDGSLVAEIKQGKDGITIKLADRMKALAWLTEYFELNPADVHRRESDKRKIELAAVRVCQNEELEDLEELTQSDMENAKNEKEVTSKASIKKQGKANKFEQPSSNQTTDNFENALKSIGEDIWSEDD